MWGPLRLSSAADGQKGRRPSFDRAAKPEEARTLFELFTNRLRELGVPVETGAFGQYMQVELIGDGPATYQLEEPKAR
jgi:D-aminoacyl-tRNA deacylase